MSKNVRAGGSSVLGPLAHLSVAHLNTRNGASVMSGVVVCTPPGSDHDQSLYWSLCDTLQTDKQHTDETYRTNPALAALHVEQWLTPGAPVFVAQTSRTEDFPFFRALHVVEKTQTDAVAERNLQLSAAVAELVAATNTTTTSHLPSSSSTTALTTTTATTAALVPSETDAAAIVALCQRTAELALQKPSASESVVHAPAKPLRILALYDDPLVAALDDFFAHIEQHTHKTQSQLTHMRAPALIGAFLALERTLSGVDRHTKWLESLARALGVTSLDTSLPPDTGVVGANVHTERGWYTIKSDLFDGVRILLLDRQRLVENTQVIGDFLGLPRGAFKYRQYPTVFDEPNAWQVALRQKFMDRFQYPRELARAMYASPFARRFGYRLTTAPAFVEPVSSAVVRERVELRSTGVQANMVQDRHRYELPAPPVTTVAATIPQ